MMMTIRPKYQTSQGASIRCVPICAQLTKLKSTVQLGQVPEFGNEGISNDGRLKTGVAFISSNLAFKTPEMPCGYFSL